MRLHQTQGVICESQLQGESARVGVGAAFNETDHSDVWANSRGVEEHKIRDSPGHGFPVMSRKIARSVFSSPVWLALN